MKFIINALLVLIWLATLLVCTVQVTAHHFSVLGWAGLISSLFGAVVHLEILEGDVFG